MRFLLNLSQPVSKPFSKITCSSCGRVEALQHWGSDFIMSRAFIQSWGLLSHFQRWSFLQPWAALQMPVRLHPGTSVDDFSSDSALEFPRIFGEKGEDSNDPPASRWRTSTLNDTWWHRSMHILPSVGREKQLSNPSVTTSFGNPSQ